MSRMPFNSLLFKHGDCDLCGAEDVEISSLSEITDDVDADDDTWICVDCIEEEYSQELEDK